MDIVNKTVIERILEPIDSINDLDANTLHSLRATSAGRFVIDKFKVSIPEWWEWLEKDPNNAAQGIEYDAQENDVIIKANPTELAYETSRLMRIWFTKLALGVDKTKLSRYRIFEPILHNQFIDHEGSRRGPDGGLIEDRKPSPLVALLVAVSEPSRLVFRDAERLLENRRVGTELVIIIDIQEDNCQADRVESEKNSGTIAWGLSDEEIRKLSHDELQQNVLDWYAQEGIPLLGDFTARIYLCFPEEAQELVWESKFSLGEEQAQPSVEHGKCSISLRDIIAGFDGDDEFPLPLEELSKCWSRHLEGHRKERAGKLAYFKMKGLEKED